MTRTDSTDRDGRPDASASGAESESNRANATRPGLVLAVGADALAVAVAATAAWTTAIAAVGAVAHVTGVLRDRPRARRAGSLALLAATLAGVLTGLGDLAVLAGVVLVVVAYDAGERTVSLHAHAPGADTAALEGRRTAWTLAVCAVAALAAALLARAPTTASPTGAALALAGGVLVALSLRD
ncbi:hypothetical protein [Halorubellus sp. PRR65]|uniref:DUF7519 family protein n=1 Tax=Halorubellus sp. PRR65 TaxID=3098148 RepID=UPI002B25CD7A|nr:hypothetical protein [Halorubellus sp. PRR65]